MGARRRFGRSQASPNGASLRLFPSLGLGPSRPAPRRNSYQALGAHRANDGRPVHERLMDVWAAAGSLLPTRFGLPADGQTLFLTNSSPTSTVSSRIARCFGDQLLGIV